MIQIQGDMLVPPRDGWPERLLVLLDQCSFVCVNGMSKFMFLYL